MYETALQYQGVPYVFGGADPSGFDCSGLIKFVYAQYGNALPHSVVSQDLVGVPRPTPSPVTSSCSMTAPTPASPLATGRSSTPYPGASVRIQPLWTSDVHVVRFGTNG